MVLMDVPGLADQKLRQKAAAAMTKALQQGGGYKVVFVVKNDSGRVREMDIATMQATFDSAPIKEYGVIVNFMTKGEFREMSKADNASRFFADLLARVPAPTKHIHLVKFDDDLDAVDNAVPQGEMMVNLEMFIKSLPTVTLDKKDVKQVDGSTWEQKLQEEKKRSEELTAKQKELEELVKNSKDLLEKKELELQAQQGHAETVARQENSRFLAECGVAVFTAGMGSYFKYKGQVKQAEAKLAMRNQGQGSKLRGAASSSAASSGAASSGAASRSRALDGQAMSKARRLGKSLEDSPGMRNERIGSTDILSLEGSPGMQNERIGFAATALEDLPSLSEAPR